MSSKGRLGATAMFLDRVLPEVGSTYLRTLAADELANVIRNVWAHAIIFCGHFPTRLTRPQNKESKTMTLGGWYVRQLIGTANIEGSPLFHVIGGNLGYQVEHHLDPDMPSSRYLPAMVHPLGLKSGLRSAAAVLGRKGAWVAIDHGIWWPYLVVGAGYHVVPGCFSAASAPNTGELGVLKAGRSNAPRGRPRRAPKRSP